MVYFLVKESTDREKKIQFSVLIFKALIYFFSKRGMEGKR
jgi:hypothetical protein